MDDALPHDRLRCPIGGARLSRLPGKAPASAAAGDVAAAGGPRIPRILHYVWVGGTPLPRRFRRNIRTWIRFNPGYEVRLWDERTIDWSHPFIQEAHRQKAWAKLSDFVRLHVVEQHGGFYLDTDIEVCASLEPLRDCACVFGYQSERPEDDPVCNAMFGAVPQHPFIRQVIETFPVDTKTDLYEVGTGPELVSALLLGAGLPRRPSGRVRVMDVDVMPPAVFYPYHWTEDFRRSRHVTPDTVAIHHWDMSWHHSHSASALRAVQRLVKSVPALYRPLRRLYRAMR